MKPGQPATKRLLEKYGDHSICVRYLYDADRGRKYKTVELTVKEKDRSGPRRIISPHKIVAVQVALNDMEPQRRIKQAGDKWNSARRLWELSYGQVVALKLEGRMEKKPFC